MRKLIISKALFLVALCLTSIQPLSALQLEAVKNSVAPHYAKRQMLSDLDFIRNCFEVKYAPAQWKERFFQWNLDSEMQKVKSEVERLSNPTVKEFQILTKKFFNSTRDYHVGIQYYSTELALLPITIKRAENRYFLVYIDRELLPAQEFPFLVGDEIIKFDGKPIDQAVKELKERELGSNTLETDQTISEMMLTHRRGTHGDQVPEGGEVKMLVRQLITGKEVEVKLPWIYFPEEVHNLGGPKLNLQASSPLFPYKRPFSADLKEFVGKSMTYPYWEKAAINSDNPYDLGAKRGVLPALGNVLWRAGDQNEFDAYLFTSPSGKKVGYVRIPHYNNDEEEVRDFIQIIKTFQAKSDALIIDQCNNPGGSVFYTYALLATLTKTPLETPKHHIALTQQEVHLAVTLLPALNCIENLEIAKQLLGETFGGYPMSMEVVKNLKEFCEFVIKEWNSGKVYSSATHLLGIDHIHPYPGVNYTKPILVLINEMDFSCGDFFPAILQDCHRATLMGVRTAGAGGYVLTHTFPNHTGIRSFRFTGSFSERKDGQSLENLGVHPDIPYQLTSRDLKENYRDYVRAILENIENLMR